MVCHQYIYRINRNYILRYLKHKLNQDIMRIMVDKLVKLDNHLNFICIIHLNIILDIMDQYINHY